MGTRRPSHAERVARDSRAERWEQRLALPVILAAAVSVPAVFLTMLDDRRAHLVGHTLNWASLLVLTGEAGLLLLLSGHRRAWLWRHRWTLAITVLAVPAVIYAAAPVQALRLLKLVRLFGTLRILRANTIVNAGRVLARRFGLGGLRRYALVVSGSLLAAGFVALVLIDPATARQHRMLFEELRGWLGLTPGLVAALVVAPVALLAGLYWRGARTAQRQESDRTGGPDDGG